MIPDLLRMKAQFAPFYLVNPKEQLYRKLSLYKPRPGVHLLCCNPVYPLDPGDSGIKAQETGQQTSCRVSNKKEKI